MAAVGAGDDDSYRCGLMEWIYRVICWAWTQPGAGNEYATLHRVCPFRPSVRRPSARRPSPVVCRTQKSGSPNRRSGTVRCACADRSKEVNLTIPSSFSPCPPSSRPRARSRPRPHPRSRSRSRSRSLPHPPSSLACVHVHGRVCSAQHGRRGPTARPCPPHRRRAAATSSRWRSTS